MLVTLALLLLVSVSVNADPIVSIVEDVNHLFDGEIVTLRQNYVKVPGIPNAFVKNLVNLNRFGNCTVISSGTQFQCIASAKHALYYSSSDNSSFPASVTLGFSGSLNASRIVGALELTSVDVVGEREGEYYSDEVGIISGGRTLKLKKRRLEVKIEIKVGIHF